MYLGVVIYEMRSLIVDRNETISRSSFQFLSHAKNLEPVHCDVLEEHSIGLLRRGTLFCL